jgi:hypothetical protein
LDYVTSLYATCGHMPEPYELLFCTESTPLELIQSVLFRCILNTKHNSRPNFPPLYCLVNIHNLTTNVQIEAIKFIKRLLLDDLDESKQYSLVLIAGNTQGQLVSSLQKYVRSRHSPLGNEDLENVFKQIYERMTANVTVYTSEHPGSGKSYAIEKKIIQQKLTMCKISVNSSLTTTQFINQLKSVTVNSAAAYHFNISSTATSDLNFQCYQLIVVGLLQDVTGNIYKLSNKHSLYFELPSLPSRELQSRLFFFKNTPNRVSLTMDNVEFDHTHIEIQYVARMINLAHTQRWLSEEKLRVKKEPVLDSASCRKFIFAEIQRVRPQMVINSIITVIGSV